MIERCPVCESKLKFTPWEQLDNRVRHPRVTCVVSCGFSYEVDPNKMTIETNSASTWENNRLRGLKAEWVIKTRFKIEGKNENI